MWDSAQLARGVSDRDSKAISGSTEHSLSWSNYALRFLLVQLSNNPALLPRYLASVQLANEK